MQELREREKRATFHKKGFGGGEKGGAKIKEIRRGEAKERERGGRSPARREIGTRKRDNGGEVGKKRHHT